MNKFEGCPFLETLETKHTESNARLASMDALASQSAGAATEENLLRVRELEPIFQKQLEGLGASALIRCEGGPSELTELGGMILSCNSESSVVDDTDRTKRIK